MTAQLTLGETTSGPGATGPGGRPVSLSIADLTRSVGLVAGEDGRETAAVIADALTDREIPVLVLDCDGSFSELSTRFDARSCHPGTDADRQLETDFPADFARIARGAHEPVIVDGRRTDAATLAALTRSALERDAIDERRVVTMVCGLADGLPADTALGEIGRAIRRLVTQGPDRGLGVCAVVERPATVHRVVREETAWTVWHRLTRTADASVVRRELGGERAQAVRDLPSDEAFLETDWHAAIERISVYNRDSDTDRTVDPRAAVGGGLASDDRATIRRELDDFADRLAALEASIGDRLDPDRLAADIADELEPPIEPTRSVAGPPEGTNGASPDAEPGDQGASNGSDGIGAFDLFDADSTEESDAGPGADASTADDLAALAGVDQADVESGTGSTRSSASGECAMSDGGLDIASIAAEIPAFEHGVAGVEIDSEPAEGKPAVVVDLEGTLESIGDAALAMLEHYRSDGPARPEAAHAAATGRSERVPAYTLNRRLRRAGLIQHASKGRYEYALRERIEAGLPTDRDDGMAAVYVRDLEQSYLD